jgi:lysosomal Pro-X carboxypeptidase
VSNIVFTNGLLDPWSAYGVTSNTSLGDTSSSDDLVVLLMPNGAHHVDLMFSNPGDTSDITEARRVTMAKVKDWVMEACPDCDVHLPTS